MRADVLFAELALDFGGELVVGGGPFREPPTVMQSIVLRHKFWRFPKRYPTTNSPTISNLPTIYRRALYLRIKIK